MSLPLLFVIAQVATPHALAARATTPPIIDGQIDDAVWASAPLHAEFRQKFPSEATAPEEPTSFRVLFDDANVYVAIDCVQEKDRRAPHAPRSTDGGGSRPRIDLLPGERGAIDATGLGRAPASDTVLLKLTHFFG